LRRPAKEAAAGLAGRRTAEGGESAGILLVFFRRPGREDGEHTRLGRE
ncbi:ribosome assembly RNA-binding protein YhbY, partial [Bifidobacterium longum]